MKLKKTTIAAATLLAASLVAATAAASHSPRYGYGSGYYGPSAGHQAPYSYRGNRGYGYNQPHKKAYRYGRHGYGKGYRGYGPHWRPGHYGGYGYRNQAAPGYPMSGQYGAPAAASKAVPDTASAKAADTATAGGSDTRVRIANMSFGPTKIRIQAGDTVTWTNQDGMPHTVTANDGSFDSPTLNRNGEFSKTFAEPGVYAYYCKFHPSMRGEVEVI
jgi:amicyanin